VIAMLRRLTRGERVLIGLAVVAGAVAWPCLAAVRLLLDEVTAYSISGDGVVGGEAATSSPANVEQA
jgi:hypothetical protein